MAAIRTELEVAQRTASADDWPAVADRLLAEEARLEAVISDLLLLATLDEGAPLPDAGAVDLAEEACEEARRRTRDRTDVIMEVDAPSAAMVHGSRVQLRRALANLLDNAGRHARTTVRVSVHERDGRVRVLVDDDGLGIPEADRERVFERFVRLDEHRTRAAGGAGLGLSLVRRIAERHQGSASRGHVTARRGAHHPRPAGRPARAHLAAPIRGRPPVRSGRPASRPCTATRRGGAPSDRRPAGSSATMAAVVASRCSGPSTCMHTVQPSAPPAWDAQVGLERRHGHGLLRPGRLASARSRGSTSASTGCRGCRWAASNGGDRRAVGGRAACR